MFGIDDPFIILPLPTFGGMCDFRCLVWAEILE